MRRTAKKSRSLKHKIEDVIKNFRMAISDNTEPYIYDEDELCTILEVAAAIYSKFKPARKKGVIFVEAGKSEYPLPDDYQTWLEGFENFDMFDGKVDLGFSPVQCYEITFTYLANRKLEDIPEADLPLLVDYGFYYIVDSTIKETSDISGLKLGKGLQIQFNNIDELNKAADRRLKNFNERLQSNLGGWG